ncbi:EAL domain-containing protein [Candidatus Synechococcus calcipolaris G9]|uniref:EAL domain-containing protein n=1 Tax=Candidatus Synechococcus calcipolaris G9 TaxID=1497997 RepID=A0ABT6EZC8_9SYNE|nr:GGDEF and EAL domain-containing protein [Candidatus Synechococcus calcipolaris]MDG2990971.1 EAL domain-containing protein [Candidatus Synechococcus calcipolaris G9]
MTFSFSSAFDLDSGQDPYTIIRSSCARLPFLIAFYHPLGSLITVNQEFTSILGWDTSDLVTTDVLAACFPDPGTHQQFRDWMIQPAPGWREIPTHNRDGRLIETLWAVVKFPNGSGMICGQNITPLKHLQTSLLETSERYALLVMGINDGVWDWDLNTDEVFYSFRWKTLLGYGDDELGNHISDWLSRIHPQDVERVKLNLTLHIQGQTPHFQQEFRIQHKNSGYRWALVRGLALRDPQGKAYRISGSLTDLTEHRLAEAQLLHDALHDALTGLANRTLLFDRIAQSIRHGRRRPNYNFALLFIDIDRFKVINDSLGHSLGDKVLIEISKRLTAILRPDDTVARLGGDEFVILLDDMVSPEDALSVADRILRDMERPFMIKGETIFTNASIGIALRAKDSDQPEDYVRNADLAMYRAKLAGGQRYQIFTDDMHVMSRERLAVEINLRRALEEKELCLYYQPIYSLQDNRLKGFEALIRWQHPQEGLVGPERFIDLAEETGLIIPIGNYVLWQACQQMQAWLTEFPGDDLSISVNVSNRQFIQPKIVEQVLTTLERTQLSPHCLQLEITETMVIENPELMQQVLLDLKAHDIRLNMDDFGTGYSSLSYLARLPIDVLKIDRSFVQQIQEGDEKLEIIRAIASLACSLNLEVVAEGIETAHQVSKLRELGCQYGQGYYFDRPLSLEAATELLARTPR